MLKVLDRNYVKEASILIILLVDGDFFGSMYSCLIILKNNTFFSLQALSAFDVMFPLPVKLLAINVFSNVSSMFQKFVRDDTFAYSTRLKANTSWF